MENKSNEELMMERILEADMDDLSQQELLGERAEEVRPAAADTFDLTITMPAEQVNKQNLSNLLASKGDLIKKAIGVESLPVLEKAEFIEFPWFDEVTAEEAKTYMKFIQAICELTMKQKRIAANKTAAENEKYAFRCFLLKLGFIGDEYKQDRKILLSKLSGSTAFKNGKEDK